MHRELLINPSGRILLVLLTGEKSRKEIKELTRLPAPTVEQNLAWLKASGLIEFDEKKKTFRITEKGRELVEEGILPFAKYVMILVAQNAERMEKNVNEKTVVATT